MAMLLKYRESQMKAAARPELPIVQSLIMAGSHTNTSNVNIARRVSNLKLLPRPEADKKNAIGQQLHTVEMRSGGVIAFRVPLYQKMLVGGISGVIGLCSVFPIDLIKTRLQLSSNIGLSSVCQDVFAKYGIGGFYRGLGTTAIMVLQPKRECRSIKEEKKNNKK